MKTELNYLVEQDLFETTARVAEVQGRTSLVLDATIFYPQGGGQPYDTGIIVGKNGTFTVSEVRNIEGIVYHIGLLEGEMEVSEEVILKVAQERRQLNSRVHSAAHLLDLAVHRLSLPWVAGKGYSFPEGPYVEYSGDFTDLDSQKLKELLESECAELITEDLPVTIQGITSVEAAERGITLSSHLDPDTLVRLVTMGDYSIPCGGTHVTSLAQIGGMYVRKMKVSGDVLRVSYQIS